MRIGTPHRVLNPVGFPPEVVAQGLAPGLDDLDGKRIFLVDVGWENSGNFMRELEKWFNRTKPGVLTQLVQWKDQHKPDPELCEIIQSEGDAAILGVGL